MVYFCSVLESIEPIIQGRESPHSCKQKCTDFHGLGYSDVPGNGPKGGFLAESPKHARYLSLNSKVFPFTLADVTLCRL
jgi:hypothetical protein